MSALAVMFHVYTGIALAGFPVALAAFWSRVRLGAKQIYRTGYYDGWRDSEHQLTGNGSDY